MADEINLPSHITRHSEDWYYDKERKKYVHPDKIQGYITRTVTYKPKPYVEPVRKRKEPKERKPKPPKNVKVVPAKKPAPVKKVVVKKTKPIKAKAAPAKRKAVRVVANKQI